jgi:uncharacterized protein
MESGKSTRIIGFMATERGVRMIDILQIHGFSHEDFTMHDCVAFLEKERAMLISPNHGTTLCLEMSYVDCIIHGKITNDLAFLLVQRGLASYNGSRTVSQHHEQLEPTFFLIDLTRSCNLQCVYCFRELDSNARRMDSKQLSRICNELIKYWQQYNINNLSIQAWGGEPLLELSKIIEIRRCFNEACLHPQILIETNATLITPQIANILWENDVEIGVSIDGNALVHNAQRPYVNGKPSLQAVENGIANLRSVGYKRIGSITVVTKNTAEHLEEIINYFTDILCLNSIKLNLMRKNDRNHDLAIDITEIESYVENLIMLLSKCYEKKTQIIEQNISQRIANLTHRPCNNICNAYGCHGGYRMLSIDPDGKVYPCEMTDDQEYCIGNVGEEDIAIMVQKAIEAEHVYFRVRYIDTCKNCPWLFYCRGGCRAAAKYAHDDPRDIDLTECAYNRAIYPRLVQILLTNPSFAKYLSDGVA